MEWISVDERLPVEDKEQGEEASHRVLIFLVRESSILGDLPIVTGGRYSYLWETWQTDYDDGRPKGHRVTHWAYPVLPVGIYAE